MAKRATTKKKPAAKPAGLADLKEWDRNPRAIDADALAGLAESAQEFGDLSGIVYHTTGFLIAGHQRCKALREKYGDALQISWDRANGSANGDKGSGHIETPDGRWSVRLVDWPMKKARAANVAANNKATQGIFTDAAAPLIKQIKKESGGLFDRIRLDALAIELHVDDADGLKLNASPQSGASHDHRVAADDHPNEVEYVFEPGNIKRISVNQTLIRRNKKDGTREPVLRAGTSSDTAYGHRIRIEGGCVVIYSPDKPMPNCSATVWMETTGQVTVFRDDGKTVEVPPAERAS